MPGTVVEEAADGLTGALKQFCTRLDHKTLAKKLLLFALGVLATAQFVGAYLYLEFPYVNIYRLERGYERLPFQTRLLVAPLYSWVDHSPTIVAYASRLSRNTYFFPHGVLPGDVLEFFLDIACVLFSGWVTLRMYQASSRRHLLQPLIFPLFLGLCVLAYILHTVQNFRYPYDMPSLAFFAAGFYLIYFRKPVIWFVALFAVATLNRETILLLLPFYALSQAEDGERFTWRAMVAPATLAVLASLGIYWVAWHHLVYSIFAHNASEYYPRIPFNLRCFARLRYYPQLFSAFGFLAPFLFLGRRFVADRQLRVWLWCLPIWYSFMFVWAILVETRVFGELIPYLTVYTAVMTEEWLVERMDSAPAVAESVSSPTLLAAIRRGRRAA